jgi:hypothetical protein
MLSPLHAGFLLLAVMHGFNCEFVTINVGTVRPTDVEGVSYHAGQSIQNFKAHRPIYIGTSNCTAVGKTYITLYKFKNLNHLNAVRPGNSDRRRRPGAK